MLRAYRMRLQVIVTHRCNALCDHCDKAVGYSKFPDLKDMTVEMAKQRVDELLSQWSTVRVSRVTISGGEPVLNRQLQGIIDEFSRLKCRGRVLTNDMPVTLELRDAITLPVNWAWAPSPLDDPEDMKSGKNKPGVRWRNRVHTPFWVSPADEGIESKYEQCGVKYFCGKGLDSGGFSMCGQAPIIGRLLGIDPYMPNEPDILTQVITPKPEICKHCQYGLSKRNVKWIRNRVNDGKITAISPTFAQAFEQHGSGSSVANGLIPLEVLQ